MGTEGVSRREASIFKSIASVSMVRIGIHSDEGVATTNSYEILDPGHILQGNRRLGECEYHIHSNI